ncbi:hypothetical protein EDC91_102226 [Shewanella fodinae]|jgi:hypothetical protein|uniref:Uncharacterized protein n=1 Tax=Shewanella fodinae TaxID=552357 RepID=A0A4R2FJ34_9GAMM|nr:hypothetical protein EDC91_102226 [Shewanella fodinae]
MSYDEPLEPDPASTGVGMGHNLCTYHFAYPMPDLKHANI